MMIFSPLTFYQTYLISSLAGTTGTEKKRDLVIRLFVRRFRRQTRTNGIGLNVRGDLRS